MPGHSTEPFAGFVESQHSAWINQPEGLTKVSGMFCSGCRGQYCAAASSDTLFRVAPIDSGAVLSDLRSASRVTVFTIVQFSLDV